MGKRKRNQQTEMQQSSRDVKGNLSFLSVVFMLYYNYPVLVLNTNSGANCSLLLLPLLHLFILTFEESFSELTRLKLGWEKRKKERKKTWLSYLLWILIKKRKPISYILLMHAENCDNSWKSAGDTPPCPG